MSNAEQEKRNRKEHDKHERINQFLQRKEVRREIEENMEKVGSQVKVPIGKAVELFDNQWKEPHLRYWEQLGLLHPERPNSGHRFYSLEELKKLAILIVLLREFAPSDIPTNILDVWQSTQQSYKEASEVKSEKDVPTVAIEKIISGSHHQMFDRFFISRVLYVALSFICEDIASSVTGIVLPREKPPANIHIDNPKDLEILGECLIGWFDEKRSFYTLMQVPSFEFSSDYHIEQISLPGVSIGQKNIIMWVVIERKAQIPVLYRDGLEVVRRLLQLIYDDASYWRSLFGSSLHAGTEPAVSFTSMPHLSDTILAGIANKIVKLGGKSITEESRWRFCCILLPKNTSASLLQQSLVVRAGSTFNPHKPHTTIISPEGTFTSLSLRAFQNGHIAYRHDISIEDSTIELRLQEENIRSAIAIPVGAQDNSPVAVLYVVSDELDSFSQGDQHVLQAMCRIIEEFVRTYNAHYQTYEKISTIVGNAEVVGNVFKRFYTEEDFIRDTERLLSDMYNTLTKSPLAASIEASRVMKPETVLSFIGIDINDQSTIANRYGDRLARNLSLQMGQRIKGHLLAVFRRTEDWQLYHIYADRFYLMLQGIPMLRARAEAEKLHSVLKGSYKVDALRTMADPVSLPDWLVDVPNVTVRLAVTSYQYDKLYSMLQQMKLSDVSANILRSLDAGLKRGKDDDETHGDVIYSWDNESGDFIRISSKHI